jgi:hypothetical protein
MAESADSSQTVVSIIFLVMNLDWLLAIYFFDSSHGSYWDVAT